MLISAILIACAKWSRTVGSFAAYVFEKKKQDDVDVALTQAYVFVADFQTQGLVRRAANWYVRFLREKANPDIGWLPRALRATPVGLAIGLGWALVVWIGLHQSLLSVPNFFKPNMLSAVLLVGTFFIAAIFSFDVWLVGLLARAIRRRARCIGHPFVALVACGVLAAVSWSSASGFFGATSMLGVHFLNGTFDSFLVSPHWLAQRWWVAATHWVDGAMTLTLPRTSRYVTSSAFGFPATIASLTFLAIIAGTWWAERSGERLRNAVANAVIATDKTWAKMLNSLPPFNAKRIGNIFCAVFLLLAVWAALVGL